MVRFKNRYLLVEAHPVDTKSNLLDYQPDSCSNLTSSALASQLRSTLSTNFGQVGSALTSQSLSVKYCNAATGTFIVRAAREQLPMVWAGITLMTGMPEGGGRWVWRVAHVAGTIRNVQAAAMRQAAKKIEMMLNKTRDKAERGKIQEMLKKCRTAISALEA